MTLAQMERRERRNATLWLALAALAGLAVGAVGSEEISARRYEAAMTRIGQVNYQVEWVVSLEREQRRQAEVRLAEYVSELELAKRCYMTESVSWSRGQERCFAYVSSAACGFSILRRSR